MENRYSEPALTESEFYIEKRIPRHPDKIGTSRNGHNG